MLNEYLIRMDLPEDCIRVSTREDGMYYRLFHYPVTDKMKNEIDCMQFPVLSANPIFYHEHTGGTETFLVSQGKFECYCMGRGFILQKGDILHIQPWMGHSFTPVEPGSKLNIMFQGIDQQNWITAPEYRLRANFPGVYEDPDFQKFFNDHCQLINRAAPVPNMVERETVQQLRMAGKGIREHEFEGIKMHLKVARYETHGVKEIWDLFLKPGFYCEWDNFLPEYRVFYVTGGRIHCTVKTSFTTAVEFDAVEENIVFIPPYTPFRFDVVEEAHMYDLDCPARLEDLCEEIKSYMHDNPGCGKDDKIMALCAQHGFNATDFGFK
jgi:quercetin dioxygenase-like cupin family protein